MGIYTLAVVELLVFVEHSTLVTFVVKGITAHIYRGHLISTVKKILFLKLSSSVTTMTSLLWSSIG